MLPKLYTAQVHPKMSTRLPPGGDLQGHAVKERAIDLNNRRLQSLRVFGGVGWVINKTVRPLGATGKT